MRNGIICFFTVLTIAVTASAAWAQGQFVPLGAANTFVSGMSADGSVVVGVYSNLGPAWRWTAATGAVNIGSISQTTAVSRDGLTIVGTANDASGIAYAAIWQSGTQWMTLPPPANWRDEDGKATVGYKVSQDGSVISGLAYLNPGRVEAFRYDAKSGITMPLGTLTQGRSRGSVVSSDGTVVAGWDDLTGSGTGKGFWYGVIWLQGLERLLHPFNGIGQVEGINNNGSFMVGRGSPGAMTHAYRYSAADNSVLDLGVLPPGGDGIGIGPTNYDDYSVALAVSDDGSVVVGVSGYQPPTEAFIWTNGTKMVKLSDYLTNKGITGFDGWTLINANSISPDGKIIAGTGINNIAGRVEGFVVRLP
jgi:probable HAF family extracellular repeat protein